MRLQEIYEKDITRPINPAVVVGQLDEASITQEIEEYVFSKDIIKNMYVFLDVIANKKEGKTGIWISGYYGSGKSHFIKYLFYCLNKNTSSKALKRLQEAVIEAKLDALEEATAANLSNLIKELEKKEIEEIIFNIDAVSKTKNNDTITRVFMHQLNAKRGYNTHNIAIALLIEKHLDELGKFQEFKNEIRKVSNKEWVNSNIRDIIRLRRKHIVDITCKLDPSIDKESLTEAIRNDENYSINELINELKEYVDTKGPDFRLIYLLDETSQYIGTNSDLLLNLQTIIEEIGHKIGNKVWVACTAQQDLKNLVNNTENKTAEFGKILGRFETMISLDSQDAAYITQKRVLEKNSNGINALNDFYNENKGAINNQFIFDHDLYKNYDGSGDFYLAYPFIPYQFRLISDVFLSFSRVGYVGEGVKNTERAILGITHFTAEKQKDQEIGYFISFDNFFNDQLNGNLTHEATTILNRAFTISFDSDTKPFADRVIKVLFMISNLTEDQEINFPANIENITTLLLNDVNTVKPDLQREVESVLNTLVDKNIIQVSEGKYKFLDDDGVKVANSISGTTVNLSTKLEYFYEELIRRSLRPEPSVNIGNRSVRVELSVDDLVKAQGDAFQIRFVIFDGTDIDQQAISISQNSLFININYWLSENKEFAKDFGEFCKTAKYLSDNRSIATGSRIKTLDEFASKNEILKDSLKTRFEKYFLDTPFITKNIVVNSNELKSTTVSTRYQEMVEYHVKTIYKNHSMSDSLAQTNNDLQTEIARTINTKLIDNELNIAEEEVNSRINHIGPDVILSDLIKEFDKIPYGWKDISVLHIVFNLVKKKYRNIEYQNEELELKDYYDKAINSRSRDSIEIKPPTDIDPGLLNEFKTVVKQIFLTFNITTNTNDEKELIREFKDFLESKLKEANTLKEEYVGYAFHNHLKDYHFVLKEIYQTRSDEAVMKLLINKKTDLQTKRDIYTELNTFIRDNIGDYDNIRNFFLDEKSNIENLETDIIIEDIFSFFKNNDRPSDDFPFIYRQYKNLKKELDLQIKELKEEVVSIYDEILTFLNEEESRLELDKGNLPDKDNFLKTISKTKTISQLENFKLKADNFRLDYLKILNDEKNKLIAKEKGVEYKKASDFKLSSFSGRTLSKPEEVDEFIEELKNKLMVELGKNGKVFIS